MGLGEITDLALLNRYKRQLEVYAHLVEEKTGQSVSRMHLYYTGEESGNPVVTFNKSQVAITTTINEFDQVVEKIHNHEFKNEAKNKKHVKTVICVIIVAK